MKKHISKLLIIMILAVLFVPLFSNYAIASLNDYFTLDPDLVVLKQFANNVYSTDTTGLIYYLRSKDSSVVTDRYILANTEIAGWQELFANATTLVDSTGTAIKGKFTNVNKFTTGNYKPNYYNENINNDYYYQYIMNYDDFLVENYPKQIPDPPEINTRPVLDLPFYIMYSDYDYSFINLQSYESIPTFTFGAYSDVENLEFDVNWYGHGNMKRYIYQDGEWYLSETKVEGEYWNDTGLDRKKILECNHSILDYTGDTSLDPINFSSGEPPKILGGSFDQQGYGVKFILPRNGFKDNSFIWRYQTWFRLPYDDIQGDKYVKDTVVLGFGGDYKEGTKQVDFSNMEVKTIDGRKVIEGYYTVSVGHDIGVNEVTFQAKRNNDEKYWSASLQTERLAGFVDEDGDGLDDRTGRDDNNDENPWHYEDYNPDGLRPDRGQYGDDILGTVSYYFDTLLYWLLSPFRLIAEGLQSTLTIVTDTFGWAGNFANMIGGLFSFLPPEITGMITLAFTSLIVFTIIKVVRK